MPGLMQNVIVNAIPDSARRTVRLAWANGAVTQSDFARLGLEGVFEAFADPSFFERAQVIDDGHVLAWPGELEFDADALWFEAHPDDATEAAILSQ